MIKWEKISPTQFEKLCYRLLELNKFSNISWNGATGNDKGRDLTAKTEEMPLPNKKEIKNWIVQCKRYSKKNITIEEISGFLSRCKQFECDYALIIISNQLSSSTRDWLEAIKSEYRFKIYTWESIEIEALVKKNYCELKHEFSDIISEKDTIELYEVDRGEYYFSSNEFEEIELMAFNCSSSDEAKRKINEFLEFIRDNDFII